MGDDQRGRLGLTNTCGVLAISLFGALGCGSSDGSSTAQNQCGSALKPVTFTLKDVAPAVGSSVPNSNIVQTFTIVGEHLAIAPGFTLPSIHTAGLPSQNPIGWTPSVSGADTVFTSVPISWATAPGHVELDPTSPFQDTNTGCVCILPAPTFSYEVTAP